VLVELDTGDKADFRHSFDHLVGASEQRLTQKNPGQMSRGFSLVGVQTVWVSVGYPLMDMDDGSRHCRGKYRCLDHTT
jgi:hypothetical protein